MRRAGRSREEDTRLACGPHAAFATRDTTLKGMVPEDEMLIVTYSNGRPRSVAPGPGVGMLLDSPRQGPPREWVSGTLDTLDHCVA